LFKFQFLETWFEAYFPFLSKSRAPQLKFSSTHPIFLIAYLWHCRVKVCKELSFWRALLMFSSAPSFNWSHLYGNKRSFLVALYNVKLIEISSIDVSVAQSSLILSNAASFIPGHLLVHLDWQKNLFTNKSWELSSLIRWVSQELEWPFATQNQWFGTLLKS